MYQIIRINLLEVSLSNHFQLCSDLKSAECLASIPICKSCDIDVNEVLPSLCSLFPNRKCQFAISEKKDERHTIKFFRNNRMLRQTTLATSDRNPAKVSEIPEKQQLAN